MKNLYTKKGFTLIELLIVIVIIGVLALALLPTILEGPKKARDAARLADLNRIQTAYQKYVAVDGNATPLNLGNGAGTYNADDILGEIMPDFPTNSHNSYAFLNNVAYAAEAGHYGVTPVLHSGIPTDKFTPNTVSFMIYTDVESINGNIECSTLNSLTATTPDTGGSGVFYDTKPNLTESSDNDCYALPVTVSTFTSSYVAPEGGGDDDTFSCDDYNSIIECRHPIFDGCLAEGNSISQCTNLVISTCSPCYCPNYSDDWTSCMDTEGNETICSVFCGIAQP